MRALLEASASRPVLACEGSVLFVVVNAQADAQESLASRAQRQVIILQMPEFSTGHHNTRVSCTE